MSARPSSVLLRVAAATSAVCVAFAFSVTQASATSLSPTAIAFTDQQVGKRSAMQTVTLTPTERVHISSPAIMGADAADFIVGGTCYGGAPYTPTTPCEVWVSFKPTTSGTHTAALSIANDVGPPLEVALSGTGFDAPIADLDMPDGTVFGDTRVGASSPPRTVTLTDTGTAALHLTAMSLGASGFTLVGGTCAAGLTLLPGASCTIDVAFTPNRPHGLHVAVLEIDSDDPAGPARLTLQGKGTAPELAISTVITPFPATPVGKQNAGQVLLVTVADDTDLHVSSIGITGPQSADFDVLTDSACPMPGVVPHGSTCTLVVRFKPTAEGERTAQLLIVDDASGSPHVVSLSGIGTSAVTPDLPAALAPILSAPVPTVQKTAAALASGTLTAPRQSVKSIRKAKAIIVRFNGPKAEHVAVMASISKTDAKRLHHSGPASSPDPGRVAIGSGAVTLTRTGESRLKVKLRSTALSMLARLHARLTVRLTTTISGPSKRARTIRTSLVLRPS